MSVSILILTFNEEINLPCCLESISWSDDIVVFDSYSTDQTVEIAKKAGVRVFQRRFENYAAQRNAALTEVKYKYPWVLMVDADERWPQEVFNEIQKVVSNSQDTSLYHFLRKDMFMGRWLKRSAGYPTWAGRLVKLGEVSVQREINEEYWTAGKKGFMKSHFIHYPFSKGVAFWLERHNQYSSMEAKVLAEERKGKLRLSGLFSSDPTVRRKALKQLAYCMPGRPLLVFCYLYFFRFGFLDGIPGLTYCRLRSMYEYMIDLKIKELRRGKLGLSL